MPGEWVEFGIVKEQRDKARADAAWFEEEVYRLEQLVAERDHRVAELEDDVVRLNAEIIDAQSRHPSSRGSDGR